MLKFDASIFGGELPVGLGVVGIAVMLPGGNFVDEDLFVGNTAIEALRRRTRDRHARFGNELLRGLVEANQRTIAVAWPRIDGQHVFHDGYERAVGLRAG